MSTAQDLPTRPSRLPGGPRAATAALLLLALAGGGTAVALSRGSAPAVSGQTAIMLPDSVQGLPARGPGDVLQSTEWKAKAAQSAGAAAYAAATYGDPGATLTLRVVAARTDLTGKLDQAWAVDQGTMVGQVHCTQNIQPVKGGRSGVRPTVMLCWRTSTALSAYALSIDPQHPITSTATTAAAVDQAWTAAQGELS